MKNILILTALTVSGVSFGQVIIGDAVGTATDKTYVLVEFANTNDKGIALPTVREKPSSGLVQGTLILDGSNPTAARVKLYNAKDMSTDEGWMDLSGQDGDVGVFLANQPMTDAVTATDAGKAIIGAPQSDADGVLVLESTDKAMLLPIVSSFEDIKNPAPGMMAFMKPATGSRHYRLNVFNGSQWSFWKP